MQNPTTTDIARVRKIARHLAGTNDCERHIVPDSAQVQQLNMWCGADGAVRAGSRCSTVARFCGGACRTQAVTTTSSPWLALYATCPAAVELFEAKIALGSLSQEVTLKINTDPTSGTPVAAREWDSAARVTSTYAGCSFKNLTRLCRDSGA